MANPNTSTREQFTNHLTTRPIPPSASPSYATLSTNLALLLEKLTHHPAMAPNLQQTYMTPAASKTKVYFVWDFVGRTLGYLYMVPPSLQHLSPAEKARWEEVKERAAYAKSLICDDVPGMLDLMTETMYPGSRGAHLGFGEDILEVARRL